MSIINQMGLTSGPPISFSVCVSLFLEMWVTVNATGRQGCWLMHAHPQALLLCRTERDCNQRRVFVYLQPDFMQRTVNTRDQRWRPVNKIAKTLCKEGVFLSLLALNHNLSCPYLPINGNLWADKLSKTSRLKLWHYLMRHGAQFWNYDTVYSVCLKIHLQRAAVTDKDPNANTGSNQNGKCKKKKRIVGYKMVKLDNKW